MLRLCLAMLNKGLIVPHRQVMKGVWIEPAWLEPSAVARNRKKYPLFEMRSTDYIFVVLFMKSVINCALLCDNLL